MIRQIQQTIARLFQDRGFSLWSGPFAISTGAHIGLILLLSFYFIDAPYRGEEDRLTINWADSTQQDVDLTKIQKPLTQITVSLLESGSPERAASARHLKVMISNVPVPKFVPRIADSPHDDPNFVRALGEATTPLSGTGSGDGNGDGTGGGKNGDGIFVKIESGKTYIYVLDCSGSMNRKKEGEWGTRFQRLKVELVRSVKKLGPGNKFYIILFNEKSRPMPCKQPQPATKETQQQYLKWVARQRAEGDTNPLSPLRRALKFQPDVIYFLTDGIFEPHIQRSLKRITQARTKIHTYAMGNRKSEELLRQVALTNGGKYHFVP